uniref:Ycf34 n=1 Tax=Bostrychia tenella TaxID=324755 RepID=A0A1Z1M5D3_9FLOR|nr:hypothetical protein [Bostrychia tenella]ARW61216.1 hypothetical protein [Bostrychia tenella]
MCICINCCHISNCQTYRFIEQQHLNSPKNLKKIKWFFIPKETVVNINVKKNNHYITIDWDLIECLSFTEQPGHWLT